MQVDRWSPDEAVLIVVDVQNDFCHPEGSAARAGFDGDVPVYRFDVVLQGEGETVFFDI